MLSPASVGPTEPSFANQNIQRQYIVLEFCKMKGGVFNESQELSYHHYCWYRYIKVDKTDLNQCPCCKRLERQLLKLNTTPTLWDRKAAPRTALWLGCSVGIEGEGEQHRAGPPSLEWLPTRGIDTSLALAPWSDKKKSPWTWTPSWRQNAAETSASRPPSLGSQVIPKLTLYASVDRSTLIELTITSWPC